MKMLISRFLAIIAVAAPAQVWAADVGRVLLAAGDTVAVRDKQVIKLAFGSAVQDKDLLRIGSASNLQVRFTDESILSMRENSELRIDEFRFTGKEDGTERAFFSLLKGGLRVITGLVGRFNDKNYRMSTLTATIGIRGTDYAARLCQKDCTNSDGTPARDGLYGRVLGPSHGTNRIDVANDADRKTFGMNENFYVADSKSPIEALLVPPDFVSNRLEGRKQGGTGAVGGSGNEQAASGGAGQDGRSSPSAPLPLEPLVFVSTENLSADGTLAVLDNILNGGNGGIPGGGNGTIPPVGIPSVGNGAIAYSIGSVVSTVLSISGATLNTNSQGQLTAFNATNISGLLGTTGTVVDVGSNAAAGNLHWGRWIGATINGTLPVSELHYIVGNIATLPGADTFTYTAVGGTAPRTAAGLTGSFDSRGTVTVDFVQRNLTLNAWQITFTGAAYTPQGAPTVRFTSSAIPLTPFQWNCAGSSCGLNSGIPGQFSGSFVGANAQGIGLAYRASDVGPLGIGGNGEITGVQGFKKP